MAGFLILPHAEIAPLVGIVDGFPAEDHALRVQKTGEPLERGAVASDHAVVLPSTLRLPVIVGDMAGQGAAAVAWSAMRDLMNEREPLTVVTGLQTYENMLLVGMRARRSGATGHSLHGDLYFEEVQIVGLDSVGTSGPALDRPPAFDRGYTPVQALKSTDAVHLLDNPFDGIEGLAPVTETGRPLVDRARELGDLVKKVVLGDELNQTFRTTVAGRTLSARVWWQPSDRNWYITVDGLVSSWRLQPDQSVRGTPFRVRGTGDWGRDAWRNGRYLALLG